MADDRDLTEFANAGGQPNQPTPRGHALVRPTTGLADRVLGAQPVAKERDEAHVRTKLKALAEGKHINYLGASGPCKFAPNGDVITTKFKVNIVRKGKIETLRIT